MKNNLKNKYLRGSLFVIIGFLLLILVYYERKIDRTPMLIANLEENNNRVYQELNKDNLMNILKNETGAVLLVSSRVSANKFIDLLYDYKDDYTIFVYSLKNDEMSLAFNDEGDTIVNKKQSELYDELIEYLGVYSDEQVIVQDDGTLVKTGHRVVYTPTVLFIKDGKPIYSYSFIEDVLSTDDLSEIYRQGFDMLKNGYN